MPSILPAPANISFEGNFDEWTIFATNVVSFPEGYVAGFNPIYSSGVDNNGNLIWQDNTTPNVVIVTPSGAVIAGDSFTHGSAALINIKAIAMTTLTGKYMVFLDKTLQQIDIYSNGVFITSASFSAGDFANSHAPGSYPNGFTGSVFISPNGQWIVLVGGDVSGGAKFRVKLYQGSLV